MTQRLLALLLLLSTPLCLAADNPLVKATSDHFTVISDAGEKSARQVLENFERMRWVFKFLFPSAQVDPPVPLVVLAMHNRKGFEGVEPEGYLGKGKLDLAGYFVSAEDRNFIILRLDAEGDHPFSTVFHEYTHLQYRTSSAWMPLWISEGMAEFFQNTQLENKDALVGQASANEILYLRQNSLIPIETLLRVDRDSPYYHEDGKGNIFYAESWALTHYIIVNDRMHQTNKLSQYLVQVQRGDDPALAAYAAFGDLNKLQMALYAYIKQNSFKEFILKSPPDAVKQDSFRVTPISDLQFDTYRAEALTLVRRTADAESLLTKLSASAPQNPEIEAASGWLALAKQDIPRARDAFTEACNHKSTDFLVCFQAASLTLNSGSGDRSTVEAELRQAIALNPDYAPLHDELGLALLGKNGSFDPAIEQFVKAQSLDQRNVYYRVHLGQALEQQKNWATAIAVLIGATKVARSPGDRTLAQNALERAQQQAKLAEQPLPSSTQPPAQATHSNQVMKVTPHLTHPAHPTAKATGPQHTVVGILRSVACTLPAVMDIDLEVQAAANLPAHFIKVYSPNINEMDLSALGFEPSEKFNVCKDLVGMNARIVYAESPDQTVDGQVVSVVLIK